MTADVSDFRIGPFMRAVVKNTKRTDPDEIAAEAFRLINEADHATALRQALRELARVEITRQRVTAMPTISPTLIGKARSAAVRSAFAAVLDSLEVDASGAWKRLREFTRDDLLAAAAYRRKLSTENADAADRYDALAALLARHGVARLKDVPAREAAALMGVAA